MCGIVGYVGKKSALQPVVDGLKALEYRGYDSAGITTINAKRAAICTKQVGSVRNLEQELKNQADNQAHTAIGHTRWATHGEPSLSNAHPHYNSDQSIFVVHNGIIENYQELKSALVSRGYAFASETDTEVIPHLIDWHLAQTNNFEKAFRLAMKELRGAYAIAAAYKKEPGKIFIARLSSPLVVGIGKHEHYIASDATAILDKTKEVIYLDDYDLAVITDEKVTIQNLREDKTVTRTKQLLDYSTEEAKLGDFPHFMLKEIFDTPQTIVAATRGRINAEQNTVMLGGLIHVEEQLRYIDRVVIVACGTSYYAGMVGEYIIEELAGIPVEVQLASEFKYRQEPFSRGTAVLALSQSGETADTIAALQKVEQYGVLRLGIVNAVGSTIARMTDAGVYCHAGPELSVASTKAFVAQVTILLELALHLSQKRTPYFRDMLHELEALPKLVESILAQKDTIKKVAEQYKDYTDFLYIGRGLMYPCALEGALKLKEVSYIHAEGYAAGEMKHGPLAMIDKNFPTLAIALQDEHHDKTVSNIEEIRARKGPVLAIATEGDKRVAKLANHVLYVPKAHKFVAPHLVTIALQLFAYYVATAKELNVDRPRNLAKSVTVE